MKTRFFTMILVLSSIFFISCNSKDLKDDKSKNNGCLILKDDLGRSFTCPSNIKRVMALSPSLTEYLALICPDKIVARTQNCDFPKSILKKPIIENYPEIDLEGLVKLNVDLIVTQKGITSSAQLSQLADFNIPVYVFNNDNVDKIIDCAEKVGVLTGCYRRGVVVKDSLKAIYHTIFHNEEDTLKKREFCGVVSKDPIFLYGPKSLFGKMAAQLNFTITGKDLKGNYPEANEEYFLRANPDLLVTSTSINWDLFFDLHPVLKELDAYKTKALYNINGDYISRQGPRVLMGLQELNKIARNEK